MSTEKPLETLTALVVRAARQQDDFIDRLTALGARVHSLPAMVIQPLTTAENQAQLAALRDYDKAVVVSANAARLALRGMDVAAVKDDGPVWFAVGDASAAPLREAGLTVICPERDATSEGLLALPAFADMSGQRVLIIRGEGGRDVLRSGLVARGASVTFCELYRRSVETAHRSRIHALLQTPEVVLVVAHSAEVLLCFLELVDDGQRSSLARSCALVPSDRAAQVATEAGFGQVLRAVSALTDDMVDAVVGWYTSGQRF